MDYTKKKEIKCDNDLLLQNNFTPLSFQPVLEDINVNGVNVYGYDDGDNNSVAHIRPAVTNHNRQSNVFINEYLERDTIRYYNAKTVAGNSAYGGMVKDGIKVCILSDSICKRIKLPDFNKHLNNKKAYKRCFDGSNTKGLPRRSMNNAAEEVHQTDTR